MTILLSGDFHINASNELFTILKKELIKKYGKEKYDGIKYHIILGDAGFLWLGNAVEEMRIFNTLKERSFPVLCVFGNHDPVLGRNDLQEIDIGIGEKVIVIKNENPFIAYLKRGKIYTIEGKRFLVLGGALSIDKEYRIPGLSWWKEEYWSKPEEKSLFKLFKKENNFDYVLSHTGPNRINETIFKSINKVGLSPVFFDEVAALNEKIDCKISCKQWFCGHWHKDYFYYCDNQKRGYQYLYRKTALLTDNMIEVL